MTIDEFKRYIELIINKSPVGANPTPSKLNLAIQQAFNGWLMDRIGNPQNYTNGVPNKGWQMSQKISDDLDFLLEKRGVKI